MQMIMKALRRQLSSSSFFLRGSTSASASATCKNSRSTRSLSDWTAGTGGRGGYDMTQDVLSQSSSFQKGLPPKISLQGFGPTGFDVWNALKRVQRPENGETSLDNQTDTDTQSQSTLGDSGVLHMHGSILAFPHGCFLWKGILTPKDVTVESLVPPLLLHSQLEYVFIGFNQPSDSQDNMLQGELQRIQAALRHKNIVVEQMNLANAMGTFNILNAEDRQVAVALVIDSTDSESQDTDD